MISALAPVEWLRDSAREYPVLWKLALVILLLLVAASAVRLINRVLRRTYWRRLEQAQPHRLEELRRSKRQQTILTLLESLIRYVVYGAAVVVALSIVTGGASSALFGASLVVVLVGFGLQRMLVDVVSGGLLLFEGHYAVGDFVQIPGLNAAGIVEQFSLRTTALRTLSGDRVVVMNGNITSLTRFTNGYRTYTIEMMVRDPEQAQKELSCVLARNVDSPHQRFLVGPRLVGAATLPDDPDVVRIELEAVVPPTMESLVEQSLVAQLEQALGDRLVGAVEVFNVSEPAFDAYRRSILLRQERESPLPG